MPIRQLPTLLVNQIAAGEVIERPASVVKELVENSIDAGSTSIYVTIDVGGKERIVIRDDGCGIPESEMNLALAAHATSKLACAEDLDAIATMGFRGEALASIASVSRLTLTSRTRDADAASVIEAEGDLLSEVRPGSGAPGTTVVVRNLFYNTPARRKFMRTDRTETSRVREVVTWLSMSHPEIAFTLEIDGRVSIELPPNQTPRHRALALLGKELESELLELNVEDRGMKFWGLAGRPSIARSTGKALHTFLNGRRINDRTVNHACREAYRGLIDPRRYPTAVLFIEMDPALVDVNVHPAKAEVRFRNQGLIHSAVRRAVLGSLQEADLIPEFDLERVRQPADQPLGSGFVSAPASLPRDGYAAPTASSPSSSGQSWGAPSPRGSAAAPAGFDYQHMRDAMEGSVAAQPAPKPFAAVEIEETPLPRVRADVPVLQVHSTFLVTQDAQGLVIIDQHALHERVMFEKLKSRVMQGPLESQRLLMPAVLEADAAQIEALESLEAMLERLGIEAAPMGPRRVAVHAFTSLLFERKVDPISFMQDLLGRQVEEGLNDDPEAALHEVLDMMSCKAAIKAGDRLTQAEMAELIASRAYTDRGSSCPHGRPTTLRLSIADLEKQFGR